MFRRYLFPALATAALVGGGCVPVTEPVGAVEKAEPDKALVGKWTVTKSNGLSAQLNIESLTIDAPDVKGNPKGLMRGVLSQDTDGGIWFFTTTVGKRTYASGILGGKADQRAPKFDKEGAFAEWQKTTTKRYFVFQYAQDGDTLTIDSGDNDKFGAVMKDANIRGDGAKFLQFYDAPAGWLAKYLDKTGPDKIFDGSNSIALQREKK